MKGVKVLFYKVKCLVETVQNHRNVMDEHTHTTPALEGEMSIFDLRHFAEEGPLVVMR